MNGKIKLSHDCAAEKLELTIGFWKPSVPDKIHILWLTLLKFMSMEIEGKQDNTF